MVKSARIIPATNMANMVKRPIQKNSANTTRIGRVFLYWPSCSVLAEFIFFSLNWLNFHFVLSCDTLTNIDY